MQPQLISWKVSAVSSLKSCLWINRVVSLITARAGGVTGIAILCSFVGIGVDCIAQDQDVLCSAGNGSFQAQFEASGVAVRVGAARNGELATRSCEAVLGWKKQTLTVATNVAQIDIDEFGADVGLGQPVVAFQVKTSEKNCCREYRIYSLREHPQLLRTITGGESFNAADTDLDGRVEIWTDDAAVVDGFESLTFGELVPPTIVLRFSRGKLRDVSGEFQSDFDDQISKLRREISQDELRSFKGSEGKLSGDNKLSAEQVHKLRRVKGKVLGIAWAYVYSGREQQAWDTLAAMWPASDIPRIRTAILNTWQKGVKAQTNGSTADSKKRQKRVTIFDAIGRSRGKPEVISPEGILLTRPASTETPGVTAAESVLDLLIDSAGKVRSVERSGKGTIDHALVEAAAGWKFIPALKDGRAVACRMRLSVSLRQ